MTTDYYERQAVLVSSETEKNVHYLVDFEPEEITCTCDAFLLGGQSPCKHMLACTIPMI